MDIRIKFDRYCIEMQKMVKYEDLHSTKTAMLRRKLRKMIVQLCALDEDVGSKIENFWKVAYYLPIRRYLKKNEDIMETTTLLTIFCGEMVELLACAEKYSAFFNLYLGDLHRYMAENDIQRGLTERYYSACIEIDSRHGRAFNVIGLLRKDAIPAEKFRLFISSLLATFSYNSENNIKDLISSIFLKEIDCDWDKNEILVDFINWTIFDKISKTEHKKVGEQLLERIEKMIESSPNNEEVSMILSVCGMANQQSRNVLRDGFYLHSFEIMCEVFILLLSKSPVEHELAAICEWIKYTSDILALLDSENRKMFDTLSNFLKNNWEKLCDLLCDELNKRSAEILDILKKTPEILIYLETSTLINGPSVCSQIPPNHLLSFWSQKICETNCPHFEIIENSKTLLKRIVRTQPVKTFDVPTDLRQKMLKKENEEDIISKPIYVVFDYQTIVENFKTCVKIWGLNDHIYAVSSGVLAILDKKKKENNIVRLVIREIHNRQISGKIRVVQAKTEIECCQKLIDSAKESGIKDHENFVAFCVENKADAPKIDLKGVSIYNTTDFYTECATACGF